MFLLMCTVHTTESIYCQLYFHGYFMEIEHLACTEISLCRKSMALPAVDSKGINEKLLGLETSIWNVRLEYCI